MIERLIQLRQAHPDWTLLKITEKAQDTLVSSRRRPVHPPLVSWASKAIAAAHAIPSGVVSEAIEPPQPEAPPTSNEAGATDAVADALVQLGIKIGTSVLKGILARPDVQGALASLVADALRVSGDSGSRARAEAAQDIPAPANPQVLVVGLSDEQAISFARTYRGMLNVKFDSGSAATTELRAAIAESSIVIGMDGSIASEVTRAIAQIAPAYVRHTTGLSGLRQRLADLALASDPPTTKAPRSSPDPARRGRQS